MTKYKSPLCLFSIKSFEMCVYHFLTFVTPNYMRNKLHYNRKLKSFYNYLMILTK